MLGSGVKELNIFYGSEVVTAVKMPMFIFWVDYPEDQHRQILGDL
jgi:hypothetical protein